MRWVLALSLLAAAGCTDGVAPPTLVDDLGVPDASEEDLAVEDSAGPTDLLEVDMTPQGCKTACDCPAGQACLNNTCSTSVQVFCCGTAACTGSAACQASDGRFSQCSSPADAGVQPDAGSAGGCTNTACTPGLGSQLFCTLACGAPATCSGSTMKCQP